MVITRPQETIDPVTFGMNRMHYNMLLNCYNAIVAHHIFEDILTADPLSIATGGSEETAPGLLLSASTMLQGRVDAESNKLSVYLSCLVWSLCNPLSERASHDP